MMESGKEKHAGQPRKFSSADDLKEKIDEYFEYIKGEWYWKAADVDNGEKEETKEWERLPEPCTITGLALFLGFESRQSIYDYAKSGEFSYIIKNAQFRVEHEYEKSALSAKNATFHIFALKNMGWKDQQDVKSTNVNIEATSMPISEIKRISNELDDEC